MSDWPADIDPTPAAPKPHQADQTQFTLRELFFVVAGVAVFLATGQKFGYGVPIFTLIVLSLLWFNWKQDSVSRFTRVGVAILIAFVSAIVFFILTSDPHRRDPGRRAYCQNNMREIAQAILTYQNAKGHLPPPYLTDKDGTPLCSWRVLILPYLERRDIMDQWKLDEPWNSPNNKPLSDIYLEMFHCSADHGDGTRKPLTNYVAVVGPGTAWEEDAKLNTANFKDGAGNTLLLVEIADSDINWAEPRDLNFGTMARTINPTTGSGISSKHPGGTPVVFSDKRVTVIRDDTMPNVLKALLTRDGGEPVSPADFED